MSLSKSGRAFLDPDTGVLVLGTFVLVGVLAGATGAAWLLLSALLRIFAGPSYDESANDEQRGRDDDGW